MKFKSLGQDTTLVSFKHVVAHALANDGSLYVPASIPHLTPSVLNNLDLSNQSDVSYAALEPWLVPEIAPHTLRAIIDRANMPTPLVKVGDKYILELFHGPTAAFKDVAARYLAEIISHLYQDSGHTLTILVATSGDTGGAIAQGFAGVAGARVVVLFPKGRVSHLQYEQLTRTADNVHSLEVAGTFDDCQDLVKRAFADSNLKSLHLTSANSISLGRLLPQTTYYAYAALQAAALGIKPRFVVPSGNLGNLTAGVLAGKLGFPLDTFLTANNSNDLLYRYITSGDDEAHAVVRTFSNAMDVGRPNNLPRLTYLYDNDRANLARHIAAAHVTDEQTAVTIKQVNADHGYMLDPHTAVGWQASNQLPAKDGHTDILVATASPSKFSEEIRQKTGIDVDQTELIGRVAQYQSRCHQIEAEYGDFAAWMRKNLAAA